MNVWCGSNAKTAGQDPVDVMKGMAYSTIDEINKVKKTDPAQAKYLADFVVKLFDPIITEKKPRRIRRGRFCCGR